MPALPVVLTRRAWREVEAAATQPSGGIPVASRRFHGLRRVYLDRIGYHVYYRLVPRLRRVEVTAFWHARRGSPQPLQVRQRLPHCPRC